MPGLRITRGSPGPFIWVFTLFTLRPWHLGWLTSGPGQHQPRHQGQGEWPFINGKITCHLNPDAKKIVSVWPLQSFQHRTFHTCHMWGFHETDKIKLMTKVWSGVGVDKKHLLEIFIHPHAKWNDEILLLKKIDGSICYWDTTQR